MRGWALALVLVLATAANAAEPLRLTRAMSASAFPRIAAPQTPAAAKINAALARLDRRWRVFARECRSRPDTYATRSVEAAMRGGLYLSLVARDEGACDGWPSDGSTRSLPHYDSLALVYDLDTGRPVDWRALLGPQLAKDTSTDTAIDGTTIGTVTSPALRDLYVRIIRATKPDKDCGEIIADPAPWSKAPVNFVVWLDGRQRSVVVEPVLPNVLAGCVVRAYVSPEDLRRNGAGPELLAALSGGEALNQ